MKSKIVALMLLIVAMLGLGASPALAASSDQTCTTYVADDNTIESQTCVPTKDKKAELARWGYCNGPDIPPYKIKFWDLQGFCGDSVLMNAPIDQCRLMGAWDNWAGSAHNNTTFTIVAWNTSYCGGTPFKTMYNIGYPDLYASNMGNATTSISIGS